MCFSLVIPPTFGTQGRASIFLSTDIVSFPKWLSAYILLSCQIFILEDKWFWQFSKYNYNAADSECLTIHEGVGTLEHRIIRMLSRLYAPINFRVNPPVDHPKVHDSVIHHMNPPKIYSTLVFQKFHDVLNL